MNNIIQIRQDCEHDNCYICDISLVRNYNERVTIIKNNKGAHFICNKCAIQLFGKSVYTKRPHKL